MVLAELNDAALDMCDSESSANDDVNIDNVHMNV